MLERVHLTRDELEGALDAIRSVTVCLYGDVCLDVYWRADMRLSQLSRETPHHPLPVVEERFSPGGGANVAAAIRALGANVLPVSLIGRDWRGALLKDCLAGLGISARYLLEDAARTTPAYCKPLRAGISDVVYEDPRIDFENREPLSSGQERALAELLREAAARADIIAVCDQLRFGCASGALRAELAELARGGARVVADSRERALAFSGALVKPNEVEAAAALGIDCDKSGVSAEAFAPAALQLADRMGGPAIVTLGAAGALWAEEGRVVHAPGARVPPPIDIVGAGDAFLAALCCALAAGLPGPKAVALANLCSAVTIQKIGTTGTASPDEIRREFARAEEQND